MRLIKRTRYLETLVDVMGTPDIKVITGIRRSGKSKLLEALCDYILRTSRTRTSSTSTTTSTTSRGSPNTMLSSTT